MDKTVGVIGHSLEISKKNLEKVTHRILVAGDLFPGGKPESYFINNKTETLFGSFTSIARKHDLCIAGLESPLTIKDKPIIKSGPHLKAHPECAKGIRAAGFNVLSLANNHIMDSGTEGLNDTLIACKQAGLKTVGTGNNLKEAAKPLIHELNEMKIAIVAIAENEFSIASEKSPGANPLDIVENFRQISQAKTVADFVLVLLHGGNEYYPLPSPRMIKTCRFFADVGANAVICSHIHVPGGYEIYNKVPIIYSTGNFLFDWPEQKLPGWYEGYLVSLEIQYKKVISLHLIPYFQCKDKNGIQFMNKKERRKFFLEISTFNMAISDDILLQEEWLKYLKKIKISSLSNFFGFNWIERKILRIGIWPSLSIRKYKLTAILNMIRCESHNDILVNILGDELRKH